MTTTRRVRAGQPYDCTQSGCNGLRESECAGLCMQKADPEPDELPIDFVDEEPMPIAARIAIIVLLALIVAALLIPLSV